MVDVNKYLNSFGDKIYVAIKDGIRIFSLSFKYLDFIDEKRFGNAERYEVFLDLFEFLKNNGLIEITENNGRKLLNFPEEKISEEKLKEVFPDVASISNFFEKDIEVKNYFLGYEFETFLNNCKFERVFPDDELRIYLPDDMCLRVDKKTVNAITEMKKEDVIRGIYKLFEKYYVKLEKINEIESIYSYIMLRYKEATLKYPEVVKFFFDELSKTVDRIVDDEKLLLAYDNAIYLDESKGIIGMSQDTISSVLRKIRDAQGIKITVGGILDKISAPSKEKDLKGKVITSYGSERRVSKKIYEISYKYGVVPVRTIFIEPLKRKIEEKKEEISIFDDDVKEVILEC